MIKLFSRWKFFCVFCEFGRITRHANGCWMNIWFENMKLNYSADIWILNWSKILEFIEFLNEFFFQLSKIPTKPTNPQKPINKTKENFPKITAEAIKCHKQKLTIYRHSPFSVHKFYFCFGFNTSKKYKFSRTNKLNGEKNEKHTK